MCAHCKHFDMVLEISNKRTKKKKITIMMRLNSSIWLTTWCLFYLEFTIFTHCLFICSRHRTGRLKNWLIKNNFIWMCILISLQNEHIQTCIDHLFRNIFFCLPFFENNHLLLLVDLSIRKAQNETGYNREREKKISCFLTFLYELSVIH